MRASATAAYTRPWRGRDAEAGREAAVVRRAAHPLLPACWRCCCSRRRPRPRRRATASSRVAAPGTPGVHVLPRAARAVRVRPAGRALAAPGPASSVEVRARARRLAVVALDEPRGRRRRPRQPRRAGLGRRQRRAAVARARRRGRVRVALVAADRSPLRPRARPAPPCPVQPPIISRAGWGADESHPARGAALRARRADGVRAPHGHAERLRAAATCRRSSARSTPTTCARTAGTTSATTSSSTPTGASSRAAPAASTAR